MTNHFRKNTEKTFIEVNINKLDVNIKSTQQN